MNGRRRWTQWPCDGYWMPAAEVRGRGASIESSVDLVQAIHFNHTNGMYFLAAAAFQGYDYEDGISPQPASTRFREWPGHNTKQLYGG